MKPNQKKEIGKSEAGDHRRAAYGDLAGEIRLRLFVAGLGSRSTQAVADLQRLCAKYQCDVDIIDIYERPQAATQSQIIAVPTLAREHPLPRRRIIGTIKDIDRVAGSLGLSLHPGLSLD